MFEDWLLAVGFPEGELSPALQQRKAALLRASLGTEGYRLYSSLVDNPREPYAEAVARLEAHFGNPTSTIFARAQFSRCQQRQGESINHYVATLREMAAKCGFPAEQLNERVRDQFVAWCANDKVRERLLQEPATKTLDELLVLATTVELAMAEAPALMSSSAVSTSGQVNRIVGNYSHRTSASAKGATCSNCGQVGHSVRSDSCPARGKKCNFCKKVGHFQAACRQRRGRSQTPSGRRRDTSQRRGNQYLEHKVNVCHFLRRPYICRSAVTLFQIEIVW